MSTVNDIKKMIVAAVNQRVSDLGMKQIDICRKYNLAQPRLSNLVCGKVDSFTIDAMIYIAERLGVRVSFGAQAPVMQVQPTAVDTATFDLQRCRQHLKDTGQMYPKSSCQQCGSILVNGWKCAAEGISGR